MSHKRDRNREPGAQRGDPRNSPVGWNANAEKLLAMIALDDNIADELSPIAGEAFFRAFIVQDRKTAKVEARWRFRYNNGKDSWFSIGEPKEPMSPREIVADLTMKLTKMLIMAARMMGTPVAPDRVRVFEPPDDEGHPQRTIQWLRDMDLIHAPRRAEPVQ